MCENGKKELKNFFKEENYLDTVENMYCLKKDYTNIDDIYEFLNQNAKDNYKVIVYAVNEVKLGYYNFNDDKKFIFPDDDEFNEKYIIELRLFNENEEIYLRKDNDINSYNARIIKDNLDKSVTEAEKIITIDDASTLFGKKVIDKNINDNFVKLQESGRKISLIIPSEDRAKYYALVTRSYITFDEKTGQAGIGYYRYLDIRPQVK